MAYIDGLGRSFCIQIHILESSVDQVKIPTLSSQAMRPFRLDVIKSSFILR